MEELTAVFAHARFSLSLQGHQKLQIILNKGLTRRIHFVTFQKYPDFVGRSMVSLGFYLIYSIFDLLKGSEVRSYVGYVFSRFLVNHPSGETILDLKK